MSERKYIPSGLAAGKEKKITGTPVAFVILACLIILIYSNTFNVGFVFDDDGSIVSNELVHIYNLSQLNPARLAAMFKAGRSVALLSFAVNFYFGRLNVFGYHLVNLIIHIFASWAVYLFIRSTMDLTGSKRVRSDRIAFIASLLFAVHPVQTQSVTYIVQRETSLATLFYLAAILFYIHTRVSGKKGYFFATALLFLLAVGTKQNAAILPVILLGYEFYFFQGLNPQWLKKNRGVLVGAVLSPLVAGLLYTGPNLIAWMNARYAERSFTLVERVLTQQRVLLHYLSLLFFPLPSRLNLDYDFPLSHGFSIPTVTAIAFTITALVLAVRLAKSRPILSFCILWYYINLFIESSILALEMVYEHRLYLPSIGIFLLFAVLFHDHVLRYPARRVWGMAGIAGLVAIFSFFSFRRNFVWKDDMSLWSDVIKKSPGKSRPHNNLGNVYLNRGNTRMAVEHHKRAIELDPENHDAHYNLGNDYLHTNRLDEAVGFYKEAIRLKPDYAKAYANLGTVYNALGRYDEAIAQARLALKYRPYYVDVYYNLGNAYFYKRDYRTALKHYLHVISAKPDHDKAYNNIGGVYMLLEQPRKAIEYYRKAVRYDPRAPDYVNNLGMAYKQSGNFEEAYKAYSKAMQLQPDYFDPYYNTARIMVEQKRIQDAVQTIASYLRIKPDHPRANMVLGLILADYTKEGKEAIRLLQKYLQLVPGSDKAPQVREKIEIIRKHYGMDK
jgi:tetratricopeptide (TPR) repeat protein